MLKEQLKNSGSGHENKGKSNSIPPNNLNEKNVYQNNIEETNFNLIAEESSNKQEPANTVDVPESIYRNLPSYQTSSDKTDIKKRESYTTHLDKKEDNISKKNDLASKNKKVVGQNISNIPEEPEDEKIEESKEYCFKKNINVDKSKNSSSNEAQIHILTIKDYNIEEVKNNNLRYIEKQNNIINPIEKSQNEIQKVNSINNELYFDPIKSVQKEKVLNDKEKNINFRNNEIYIPDNGNYENIKEMYENQSNNHLNILDLVEVYDQFIDNNLNNENNNYLFEKIYPLKILPLPRLDKGNFEEIQDIYNILYNGQSYDNSFYREMEQFCDFNLNNGNLKDNHNRDFDGVSENINELNLDNQDNHKNLYNFCSLEKGNFEEIESCLNNQFNANLISETNFISEYIKFCDEENRG